LENALVLVAALLLAADAVAGSAYAPGSILRRSDGWQIEQQEHRRFVPDRRLQDVPAAVVPVAALIAGRVVEETDGWSIASPSGRVHVFEESDGFTVTTPDETFRVIRRGSEYVLSPGQPGVRRLSLYETFDHQRARLRQRK